MVEKYDVEQFHDHPSPLIRYIERKRVRRILALLAARPGDRVLEIGCGAGNILAQVSGARRFGIDLAESLLAKAARRLAKRGILVQGDAEHLPFRDRAWERVYCSEVLEHIPSPAAALAEMRRIIADGGVAVVSVPNERSLPRPAGLALRGLPDAGTHGRRVAPSRLRSRRAARVGPAGTAGHAHRGRPLPVAPASLRRALRSRRPGAREPWLSPAEA